MRHNSKLICGLALCTLLGTISNVEAQQVCNGNPGIDGDLGSALGPAVATGNTFGGGNDFRGSCGGSQAEDRAYTWTAPYDATYLFDVLGSDYLAVYYVVYADLPDIPGYDCQGGGSVCYYPGAPFDPRQPLFLPAGSKMVIVIDGFGEIDTGNFVLNIEATERDVGGINLCNDNIDNDHDGLTDSADGDCICNGHPGIDGDLGSALGPAVKTGSTIGGGNDFRGSCGGSQAEDRAYTWTAPRDATYLFDVLGSDYPAVFYVVYADLPDIPEYDCQGGGSVCYYPGAPFDPRQPLFLPAGSKMVIVVDGFNSNDAGNFVININTQTPAAHFCGNQLCETGEDGDSCPEDCGFCGDLVCDPCVENADSCSDDCYCGDSICDSTETTDSCPQDCFGSLCGDLVCDWNETCEEDCGESSPPSCTGGSKCGDGHVDPGEECDDGNTNDGDCCNSLCHFSTSSCDDGNPCTTGDQCQNGVCVGGTAQNCDDGNVCTTDSCSPTSGCTHVNNTNPCNDNNACTTNDTCSGGTCVGGAAPNCDDGNACTTDSCNPASGCAHTNNNDPCDDGNACTTNDTCSGGTCAGGAAPNCDDGNACTTDSCNPASGCAHENNNNSCDDGNACTTGDTCSNGSCVGGAPLSCSDGNTCTTDSCDPVLGCVHNGGCDDGNLCTTDSCGLRGCKHRPVSCPSDNNRCTLMGTCDPSDGQCVYPPKPIDDGNLCTIDSCDPITGVRHQRINCDDHNLCTVHDHCDSANGQCVNEPKDCDDGKKCTQDSCTPSNGNCTHVDLCLPFGKTCRPNAPGANPITGCK